MKEFQSICITKFVLSQWATCIFKSQLEHIVHKI